MAVSTFSALPPVNTGFRFRTPGLIPQTILIVVAAGQSVMREVALTSKIYALEPFTVAGEREGNALAITQQRNATNVKNVISADAFGNIADQNLGNVLDATARRRRGNPRGPGNVRPVRGINASTSTPSRSTARAAPTATRGDISRGFAVDRIPADFVERIEVTKALTPDMDGDSIGGAVNLRTKSPLDRKGRLISYIGGHFLEPRPQHVQADRLADFYSDTFGPEQKIGVLFTASYNKTHKPRDSDLPELAADPGDQRPGLFLR